MKHIDIAYERVIYKIKQSICQFANLFYFCILETHSHIKKNLVICALNIFNINNGLLLVKVMGKISLSVFFFRNRMNTSAAVTFKLE